MTKMQGEAETRLERLLGFLDQDPDNLSLASDCAEAALDADRIELARRILAPFDTSETLDGRARNIAGLAAMRDGDQIMAQRQFGRLLTEHPGDPGVRFNLAWSMALSDDHAGARETLGDMGDSDLPQAAMLDLQLHHHLGEFDAAEEKLTRYIERFPDYAPLQAAASVLAIDLEHADLARRCAENGGEHPDALSTLGTLELGEQRLDDARALFARSLATRSNNPRANIGLGLVELAGGNSRGALSFLDRGAEQFGDHLGSWLAAGWAYLLAGDAATARARFDTALEKDDNFGEAHGSLAALDAFAGDFESAQRRLDIALRLDRQSFSAAMTSMVLAAAEGDQEKAQRIFELAASQPLTPDGKTLADLLVGMAL